MSGLYAADGSINVTVVDGTAYTGLYAADGSWNVVKADGFHFGYFHPCGAMLVTVATSGPSSAHAPDGSLYVEETPYTYSGAMRVTVVSGSLSSGGGGGGTGTPMGLLLSLTTTTGSSTVGTSAGLLLALTYAS